MSFAETISATFKNQSEGDFSKVSLLVMETWSQQKSWFNLIIGIISLHWNKKKLLILFYYKLKIRKYLKLQNWSCDSQMREFNQINKKELESTQMKHYMVQSLLWCITHSSRNQKQLDKCSRFCSLFHSPIASVWIMLFLAARTSFVQTQPKIFHYSHLILWMSWWNFWFCTSKNVKTIVSTLLSSQVFSEYDNLFFSPPEKRYRTILSCEEKDNF